MPVENVVSDTTIFKSGGSNVTQERLTISNRNGKRYHYALPSTVKIIFEPIVKVFVQNEGKVVITSVQLSCYLYYLLL